MMVFSSEENDEGTNCGLYCGTQVGLSTWVSELLLRFWKLFHLSD